MRFLIVEDEFTSRRLMQKYLLPYGESDIAVNGPEAVMAFKAAVQENNPYALICLDVMLPGMDGQQVLKEIRAFEHESGIQPVKEVKIVMTTALDSPKDVIEAFYRGGCTGYIVKPIDRMKLVSCLIEYGITH